jgi:hypothetical protein
MTYCSYCEEWAVIDIPANPAPVCLDHALEYWRGLLTYAREQHSEPSEPLTTHVSCGVCQELSAARARVLTAIEAAGPVPQQPGLERPASVRVTREPLRLASSRQANAVRINTSPWSDTSQPMSGG